MKFEVTLIVSCTALALASCSSPPENASANANELASANAAAISPETANAVSNTATPAPMIADGDSGDSSMKCKGVATSEWTATLNLMPGINMTPTLSVSGTVEANSSGNKYSFKLGASEESMPPTQHIDFVVTPPEIGQPTVQKPASVSGSFKNAERAYRAVSIDCDGKVLARIPVKVVQ